LALKLQALFSKDVRKNPTLFTLLPIDVSMSLDESEEKNLISDEGEMGK
jgi:hypothetical protein